MPILERDPWRAQYFADVPCPDDVQIPTDDGDAWLLFPRHRWVYDKLRICETQGITHAPHGVPPASYPVFSKPIFNLRGMGIGSRAALAGVAYARGGSSLGHMWMELLAGEHVVRRRRGRRPAAVVAPRRRPCRRRRHLRPLDGRGGRPSGAGGPLRRLARRHLRGYTGIVNFETIGGRIIEAHLRISDQWPDLYGEGQGGGAGGTLRERALDLPRPRPAGQATASSSSRRTGGATRRRRPISWLRRARRRASPRSRSPSIRAARRRSTRCRRAAFAWRS